ncbi:MAG TPA: VWA domain-containing protein [Fimbriiglobus sp.]|jgi:predicted  nucleic acid-binding Zn-ribbon protein
MKTRHKSPTLVSMWMLDVFCCALGCVTLLWLMNIREAKLEAARASTALTDLASTKSILTSTLEEYDKTKKVLLAEIEHLAGKLAATVAERDETAKTLALAKSDVTELTAKLATALTVSRDLDDQLAKKQKDVKDLSAKLLATATSADELAKLLRQRERERDEVLAKSAKLKDQLNDADAKLRSARKEVDAASNDLAAMKKTGNELTSAQKTIRDLQQKLDDSNAQIIDLQGDKKKLADKFDKLRIDSESKFAGIAMTGKRVVFLVDISGSMKLVDEKTHAPAKWPTVCETVAKVMRSLPNLEQYQVVIFSRRAEYLFGTGEWQAYKGEASIKKVGDALRAVEPVGDTNMYAAFDLAFRLKSLGLDTIYLFSDGLPTSGQGLTPDQQKLPDSAQTDILSKYIRQTLDTSWNPKTAKRVRINCVGFFYESPEVGAFLWALARDNDGSFVGMSKP